jgi:hypothetical protein
MADNDLKQTPLQIAVRDDDSGLVWLPHHQYKNLLSIMEQVIFVMCGW